MTTVTAGILDSVRRLRTAHRFAIAPLARAVGRDVRLHGGEALLFETMISGPITACALVGAVLAQAWWASTILGLVAVVETTVFVATLFDLLSDPGDDP
jgi:hypothetical protein